MKSRGLFVLSATLLFGLAATARSAQATTLFIPGASCWSPAGSPAVSISQFGIANNSASTITVYCPFALSGVPTSVSASMVAYDRSSAGDVVCTLLSTAADGTHPTSVSVQTFGVAERQSTPDLSVNSSAANPYWSFSCSLPPVAGPGASILSSVQVTF